VPSAQIPIVPNQESGWESIAGAAPVCVNLIFDGRGAVRRRPGIAQYESIASAVDASGVVGLHSTVGGELIAVGGGEHIKTLYRIRPATTVALSGKKLRGTGRPVFAETEALLVVAAGEDPMKIELAGLGVDRLGGDPPRATHPAAWSSRLFLNDVVVDKSKVNYSAPASGTTSYAGHEQWSAQTTALGTSGFVSAEARPDPILALHENTNELFAFGSTNVQTFAPDGVDILAPVSTREFGCAAVYGVVRDDQSFAWIDNRRRIVHSDGRSFSVLSDPIQQTLADMETVSDAYGFRIHHGPLDALVWKFPTDGRTFVFQRAGNGGGWSQWQGYSGGNWSEFPVTSHVLDQTNRNVVGLSSGKLGVMLSTASDDLGDPIHAYMETGFMHHGTEKQKKCDAVYLAMKRGTTTGGDEPVGSLSWRDDLGEWGPEYPVSFGSLGDYETVLPLRSLGSYRRRQWRFSFAATSDLVLAEIIEDFTVLEN